MFAFAEILKLCEIHGWCKRKTKLVAKLSLPRISQLCQIPNQIQTLLFRAKKCTLIYVGFYLYTFILYLKVSISERFFPEIKFTSLNYEKHILNMVNSYVVPVSDFREYTCEENRSPGSVHILLDQLYYM